VSLLAIQNVTKRYRRRRLEHLAIRGVSLEVERGELVAVWGPRRSGRSTLLRIAAGVERPDEGTVYFEGRDLARRRDRVLGRRIGYCHAAPFSSGDGGVVLDRVAEGLLAQHVSPRQARRQAQDVLVRVGAEACLQLDCHELDGIEAARVALACALVTEPVLLVIDEPTNGVEPLERDPLLALLRLISNEGVAVLMTTGDAQGLSGVDRAISIDNGELRGVLRPEEGRVVPLRRPATRVSESGTQGR
jgi:putative ABC transport system ATP-binding protein